MPKRTTFETIDLAEIRCLIDAPGNWQSRAAPAKIEVCQNCGHPAGDHDLDNDTCWHTSPAGRTVTLCGCLSYES